MKKVIIISLFLFISSLLWASYSPSLTLEGGANVTSFANLDTENFRYTGYVGLSVDLLSWSLGSNLKNKLAIPLGITYFSRSQIVGRKFLQDRVRFNLGLVYYRELTKLWSLGLGILPGYTFYPKISAGNLYADFLILNNFKVNNMVSLGLPLKATLSTDEIDFALGVSFTVYFLGEMGNNNRRIQIEY